MTLIDRVAPPAATTEVAPPPLAVPASDHRADARIRSVLTALDAVVARLATDPADDGITVDGRSIADPTREARDLDQVNDVARSVLRAAISRGRDELGTVRALPIRRTAWVRAHQAQLVIDRLLDAAPSPAAASAGGQLEPGLAAWQRHLVVIEHAEQGLRLVKTAIGDSTVAPDAELAGYEHGLQVLARLRPATPAVWDLLYAEVAPADDARVTDDAVALDELPASGSAAPAVAGDRPSPGAGTLAPTLVSAVGLTRRYGSFEAVRGIDFEVRQGEAFGFLGPNGAGKSSTMRMIGATSVPSGGTLRILGRDPARDGAGIRARLGVVPQDDTLDQDLTVRENLFIYGRYFGLSRKVIRERCAELLEFAQLVDKADERVQRLSGGMRRRLTIARALINRPEVILLDEPTTGLDPQARHVLWERLHQLRRSGVTLVMTTHYMDEAEQLCDRLVIMDAGRIVARGVPRQLIADHVTREVLEVRHDDDVAIRRAVTERTSGSLRVDELPGRSIVYADDGDAVAEDLHRAGVPGHLLYVRRSTLEDVFLHLTGRALID